MNEKEALDRIEGFLCDMTLITGAMIRADGEAQSWDSILTQLGAVAREAGERLKDLRSLSTPRHTEEDKLRQEVVEAAEEAARHLPDGTGIHGQDMKTTMRMGALRRLNAALAALRRAPEGAPRG